MNEYKKTTHDDNEMAVSDIVTDSNLDPQYRFDSFIVDENNQLAKSAAVALVETENPKEPFLLLYIYGDRGTGKTHLMSAIGNYISETTNRRVLYATAEQFIDEMKKAMYEDSNEAMCVVRQKYYSVDVLLVDDLKKIVKYPPILEEFFHILNRRIQEEKVTVVTCKKHPVYVKAFDERFQSRYRKGLIVDIAKPLKIKS